MKRSQCNVLKQGIGQHVLVEYVSVGDVQKVQKTLRKLIKVYFNGIVIDTPTGGMYIPDMLIKKVMIKNLLFLTPRDFFFNFKQNSHNINTYMDMVNTQIIEQMKQLSEYELLTRSAKFIKNGFLKKYKQKQNLFEIEVFHWVKKPQHLVELCPLALLNNQLLLAIYMKRFILFKKNLSVVFADKNIQHVIDFIFECNDKIREKRATSLRSLAEDLL